MKNGKQRPEDSLFAERNDDDCKSNTFLEAGPPLYIRKERIFFLCITTEMFDHRYNPKKPPLPLLPLQC